MTLENAASIQDLQFGFVTRVSEHRRLAAYARDATPLPPERLGALQRIAACTMPRALRRAMRWIGTEEMERLVAELRAGSRPTAERAIPSHTDESGRS